MSDQLLMRNPTVDQTLIFLPSFAETEQFGRLLGDTLRSGDVVLLSGPIGSGKTTLARAAIAERIGYAEDIPSPTFTLVQIYEADATIWHSDLYRVTEPDEIVEIGLEDAFSDSIVFVEWPDRLSTLTPDRRLELTLAPVGEGREVSIRYVGGGWTHVASALSGYACGR